MKDQHPMKMKKHMMPTNTKGPSHNAMEMASAFGKGRKTLPKRSMLIQMAREMAGHGKKHASK